MGFSCLVYSIYAVDLIEMPKPSKKRISLLEGMTFWSRDSFWLLKRLICPKFICSSLEIVKLANFELITRLILVQYLCQHPVNDSGVSKRAYFSFSSSSLIPCFAPSLRPPVSSACGARRNRWHGRGCPPDGRRESERGRKWQGRETGKPQAEGWDEQSRCGTQMALWSLQLGLGAARLNSRIVLVMHIRG